MANDHEVNPAMQALRLVGRGIAVVVVVFWAILDEVLFPPFRPLIAWLSRRRIFETIGELIGRAPPYLVLVLLIVPFVMIEPLKLFALYWIAVGHIYQGTVLLVFSHVLSIFTLDRIYHTGKHQLAKIGWFARLMGWLVGLRDWAFGWVKHTAAWKAAAQLASGARDWLRTLVRSAR
jgi:hypothetical protein